MLFKQDLPRRIIATRVAQGISQAELARRSRVSASTLCSLESGFAKDLKVLTLIRIAKALGVSAGNLLDGDDEALLDHLAERSRANARRTITGG